MLNEILTKLGFKETEETLGFKCTVLGRKGVYIEGIKKVKRFTSEHICLQIRVGQVEISGRQLEIKCMSKHDVIVSGEIEKVEMRK